MIHSIRLYTIALLFFSFQAVLASDQKTNTTSYIIHTDQTGHSNVCVSTTPLPRIATSPTVDLTSDYATEHRIFVQSVAYQAGLAQGEKIAQEKFDAKNKRTEHRLMLANPIMVSTTLLFCAILTLTIGTPVHVTNQVTLPYANASAPTLTSAPVHEQQKVPVIKSNQLLSAPPAHNYNDTYRIPKAKEKWLAKNPVKYRQHQLHQPQMRRARK